MSAAGVAPQSPRGMLERLRGSPLLLMLDVDGTLAPIAPRPEEAVVSPETRQLVAAFAARGDTRVVLVSGRTAADALRMVGGAGLWAAGNHGFEVITPDGVVRAHPAAEPYRDAIGAAVADLRAELAGVEGAFVEDKVLTISVHYRLVDPAVAESVRDAAERVAAARGLRADSGKMIVELRPPVAVDKGTAVIALIGELDGDSPTASLFFAGDDVTDENAFRRLRAERPAAVTVHVGERPDTAAEFRVRDVGAFRELLAAVLDERRVRPAAPAAPRQ